MNNVIIILAVVCTVLTIAMAGLFVLACVFKRRMDAFQNLCKSMVNNEEVFLDLSKSFANLLEKHGAGLEFLRKKTFDALSLGNLLENLAGRLNTEQYLRRMNALEKEFGMEKK